MQCKSINDGTITLIINEDGRESSTYILGRRVEIERVCCEVAGKRLTLRIEGEKQVKPTATRSIDPEVAASDIVKTASDLFDGTLLRVQEVEQEEDHSLPPEETP